MSPIIGNAIVIVVLAIVLFFSGRKCVQIFKNELAGKGCSGCSGGCNCNCHKDSGCSECK